MSTRDLKAELWNCAQIARQRRRPYRLEGLHKEKDLFDRAYGHIEQYYGTHPFHARNLRRERDRV